MRMDGWTCRFPRAFLAWMIALGIAVGLAGRPARADDYLGPCALAASKDGETVYVANGDANQLAWVDLAAGEVERRKALPAPPSGLVLSPDGETLYVTCAAPSSTVLGIDPSSGEVRRRMSAGHTAMGPAVTPDGKRLYVCNRFDHDVSVIDLTTGEELTRVRVDREPVAAAVSPDGRKVIVANHLPNTRTDVFYVEAVTALVTIIDVHSQQTMRVRLPSGSHTLRDVCISPDGAYAFVTHLHSNFDLVPTQLDMGWATTNVLSIVDLRKESFVKTVGLDEMNSGVANPWGVDRSEDGKLLCVSHAGAHEISVIETSILFESLPHLFISPFVGSIPEEDRPGGEKRRRIPLPGKGPRALEIVGSKVCVAEYFTDTLAVVDLEAEADAPVTTIALGPPPKWTLERRGEMLFNDAKICYQEWHSCASCHPDGRSDALNWDLMNDGVGNTKNTKSLVLAPDTPPSMAEAVRPTALDAVQAGIEHILFAVRPEGEANAIHEYLARLDPVPSPYLVDGRLSAAAERGKKLFESNRVGCHKCHPAPLYTDQKMHNVGTPGAYGITLRLDTPTLIEVWRTAPYFHHGRHTTVQGLISEGKHGDSRGDVSGLSEQEIEDLAEFVLSL